MAGRLNSTASGSSGSYDVWFNVPQSNYGTHYVWVTDGIGDSISVPITVIPYVDLSSSTGQPGDSVSISYYGYNSTVAVRTLWGTPAALNAFPAWPSTALVTPVSIGSFDGSTSSWSGTFSTLLLQPGSFRVSVGGVVYAVDDLHGNLRSNNAGSPGFNSALGTTVTPAGIGIGGTINYITGKYDIKITPAQPLPGSISATYSYFVTTLIPGVTFVGSGTTNSVGSITTSETVPNPAPLTNYGFAMWDDYGTYGESAFTIGPVITVNPSSTTTGNVVYIQGRGFTSYENLVIPAPVGQTSPVTLSEPGMSTKYCYIYSPTAAASSISVDATGRFSVGVIVPQGNNINKDDYTWSIVTTGGTVLTTTDSWTCTGLAAVSVTPTFGGTGTKVTVSGTNFPKISSMTVTVTVHDSSDDAPVLATLGTVSLSSSGTFSKAFTVSALVSGAYTIEADAAAGTNIGPDTAFSIGNLLIALSETSGPVGSTLQVTGSGFTYGNSYNVTLGSSTLVSSASGGNRWCNQYLDRLWTDLYTDNGGRNL